MKIIILLHYSFPDSHASANRFIAIAKALKYSGHYVKVISFQATRVSSDVEKYSTNGIFEGIEYENATGISFRHKSFTKRNYYKIYGKLRLFDKIFTENKKGKIDFVFFSSRTPLLNSALFFYLKAMNIKSLIESSEFPEIFLNRTIKGYILYFLYKNVLIRSRFVTGMILMTHKLDEYYKKLTKNKIPTLVLPMSVDMSRFNSTTILVHKEDESYIAYCGSLNNQKDGIDILIKSYLKIRMIYPKVKLYIIGGTTNAEYLRSLKNLVNDLNLEQDVSFKGFVDRADVPPLLSKAIALALARPSSLQASGGFPTKLGEYLATSKPVVVTDVGEITKYLKDGVSAYISEPDSVEAFSDKLLECISDPERSKMVGFEGFKVASDNFDYKRQSIILNSYLINLNGKIL
jgi:glycosyltransferase involved in cell wall biosynthesis